VCVCVCVCVCACMYINDHQHRPAAAQNVIFHIFKRRGSFRYCQLFPKFVKLTWLYTSLIKKSHDLHKYLPVGFIQLVHYQVITEGHIHWYNIIYRPVYIGLLTSLTPSNSQPSFFSIHLVPVFPSFHPSNSCSTCIPVSWTYQLVYFVGRHVVCDSLENEPDKFMIFVKDLLDSNIGCP
jgi:hypothetical protein